MCVTLNCCQYKTERKIYDTVESGTIPVLPCEVTVWLKKQVKQATPYEIRFLRSVKRNYCLVKQYYRRMGETRKAYDSN